MALTNVQPPIIIRYPSFSVSVIILLPSSDLYDFEKELQDCKDTFCSPDDLIKKCLRMTDGDVNFEVLFHLKAGGKLSLKQTTIRCTLLVFYSEMSEYYLEYDILKMPFDTIYKMKEEEISKYVVGFLDKSNTRQRVECKRYNLIYDYTSFSALASSGYFNIKRFEESGEPFIIQNEDEVNRYIVKYKISHPCELPSFEVTHWEDNKVKLEPVESGKYFF